MDVEKIRDEGQTLGVPMGKVLGIVDTNTVFDAVLQALHCAGLNKITAISGEEGV